VSEDINTYKQYQDIITAVEYYNSVNIDSSFYSKMHENVERKLSEIISAIPDGSNQEDTVQYFCKWLVENMVYDPIMANQILSGSFSVYDGLLESGNITSILKGEGVCAGFDMILTTLCNRVGIESYITIGITPDGRHTWSAIKIGNEVYYKDTTYEIVKKEVRPLMTRTQFYAKNKSYKPFSDIFANLWAK
jgi:transglutaminase/protease-like cytokinesis protein 3